MLLIEKINIHKILLLTFLTISLSFTVAVRADLCKNPFDEEAWKNATPQSIACLDMGAKKDDLTLLHAAVLFNKNPEVITALIENGSNVHALLDDGFTPLHLAAMHNTPEVIAVLIENGANINAVGGLKVTPLHAAAAYQNKSEIVLTLIKNGADVKARMAGDFTPLHLLAGTYIVNLKTETALLLLEYGADVNAKNENGNTPIHLAVEQSLDADFNLEIISTLLKNGADANIKNNAGQTALQLGKVNKDFVNSKSYQLLKEHTTIE